MFNIYKFLPMTGFEPRISGIISDRSTNWATQPLPNFFQRHFLPRLESGKAIRTRTMAWTSRTSSGRATVTCRPKASPKSFTSRSDFSRSPPSSTSAPLTPWPGSATWTAACRAGYRSHLPNSKSRGETSKIVVNFIKPILRKSAFRQK